MSTAAIPMDVEQPSESSGEQSVTAMDYINRQLELEKEARELMPYSFNTCTYSMGPLRQPVYACKAHSPEGAALCYSCSISCHGDCDLVELFNKRNIQCDCGTTRLPNSPCTLRNNVMNDTPAETNRYCHNYHGRFCACDKEYDAAKETGTMYQCILGDACNEDWFHDACIVGEQHSEEMEDEPVNTENGTSEGEAKVIEGDISIKHEITTEEGPPTNGTKSKTTEETTTEGNTSNQTTNGTTEPPVGGEEGDEEDDDDPPPGFPRSSTFTSLICWLCVAKNPWLRNYAGTPGFLPAVIKKDAIAPPIIENTTAITVTTTITTTIETNTSANITEEPSTTATSSSNHLPPSKKRKATDDSSDPDSSMLDAPSLKRVNKSPSTSPSPSEPTPTASVSITINGSPPPLCTIPPPPSNLLSTPFSLFLTSPPHTLPSSTFCHCPLHLPLLSRFPVLTSTEEEPAYEPPLSRSASPTGSHHSILDMGERALSTIDRVRAIEGVMAYNHMKEKVREFLKPFAEGGGVVGAEDVRKYFEKLRGEGVGGNGSGGLRKGRGREGEGEGEGGSASGSGGSNRKEQSGY